VKLGELEYFCNCLLKSYREHVTAPDNDGNCVYCGHHAVHRPITDSDIRRDKKYGEKINKLKREYLEVLVKDMRYDEKVN